jgi:LuxR family maltose regulon positive regulatory protein
LQDVVRLTEARGVKTRVIDGYVLLAMAASASGDQVTAARQIDAAVAVAATCGCIRRFVRMGAPVEALLRARMARDPSPFVQRLLDAFALDAARNGGEGGFARGGGLDSISSRELEVLRLLNAGLTAEEIGQRIFLAESTVRSHIKSIYMKLGAHRRLEALRKAAELGLL